MQSWVGEIESSSRKLCSQCCINFTPTMCTMLESDEIYSEECMWVWGFHSPSAFPPLLEQGRFFFFPRQAHFKYVSHPFSLLYSVLHLPKLP